MTGQHQPKRQYVLKSAHLNLDQRLTVTMQQSTAANANPQPLSQKPARSLPPCPSRPPPLPETQPLPHQVPEYAATAALSTVRSSTTSHAPAYPGLLSSGP